MATLSITDLDSLAMQISADVIENDWKVVMAQIEPLTGFQALYIFNLLQRYISATSFDTLLNLTEKTIKETLVEL